MATQPVPPELNPTHEPGPTRIHHLPTDILHQIFSRLPLHHVVASRSACKYFNAALSSPTFLQALPPLHLLALRQPHISTVHAYDPSHDRWLSFPLDFLPFSSIIPVASSRGALYLWSHSDSSSSLVLCNPLTRRHRVLPCLDSTWSRHSIVLVSAVGHVIVLSELAALYFSDDRWMKFSSNLPSKPRSPVVVCTQLIVPHDLESWIESESGRGRGERGGRGSRIGIESGREERERKKPIAKREERAQKLRKVNCEN